MKLHLRTCGSQDCICHKDFSISYHVTLLKIKLLESTQFHDHMHDFMFLGLQFSGSKVGVKNAFPKRIIVTIMLL